MNTTDFGDAADPGVTAEGLTVRSTARPHRQQHACDRGLLIASRERRRADTAIETVVPSESVAGPG
jgi:hypothetical protein